MLILFAALTLELAERMTTDASRSCAEKINRGKQA
jgi:hypothetical protein